MEQASVPRLAQQSKVAVILRGVAGCGKSREAGRIADLAQGEGLAARLHATNEQWWTKREQPPHCKCGVQMVMKNGLETYVYMCQHREEGCGTSGRAEQGSDGRMFLYIPNRQLDAELATLSAFMQDLESGCDVVIAENAFIHQHELYPYACAAILAGYVTYVVDMQGPDVDTADANSRRVGHMYSEHESNRAVIERQRSQWQPITPAVLPKQCRIVECPYGKSKAHIVLAHIFSSEAFQRQPAQLLSSSHLGQGSSAQTLALDWRLQHTDASLSPNGKAPAAVGAPNASSGQSHGRHEDDTGCQAEACVQVGEVSSPESAPHAASAQRSEPAQCRQAGQSVALSAQQPAAEKQFREAAPAAAPSSVPAEPSRRDPRLRPRGTAEAAGPSRAAAAAAEEEVVCLISDSEDEPPPPAAGPSRAAGQTRPAQERPSLAAVGPDTHAQALPASRGAPHAARPAGTAEAWQQSAVPAEVYGAPDLPPAPPRRQRTARRASARAAEADKAAAAAPDSMQAGGRTVGERDQDKSPGRKKAKRRRLQGVLPLAPGADLRSQSAEPDRRVGDAAEVQPAAQPRRSRQQQLSFPVQKQARQGSEPQKAAPGRAAGRRFPGEKSSQEAEVYNFLPDGGEDPKLPEASQGRGLEAVAEAQVARRASEEKGLPESADHGEATAEEAAASGPQHVAPASDFYSRHRGSPVTAAEKGKAPVKEVAESKIKWWADAEDDEMCLLMEDLSGAGIRSRFDEQKVSLPDLA